MPKRSALRRAPRFPIVFPVSYQLESPEAGSARAGHTCSMSSTGACLELSERLPPKTRLGLTIQTDQERVRATASVVWVERFASPGGTVRHGLSFAPLTLDQQEVLRGVIRRYALVWSPARVQLSLPARCVPQAATNSILAGWTADVGRAGLALDLPRRLPVGMAVAVTLAAPRGEVTATAMIVWVEPCDPIPPGRCLRHGLQLTNPGSVWDLLGGMQSGESLISKSEGSGSPAAAA